MPNRMLMVTVLLGWSQIGWTAQAGREHTVPLFVPADTLATGAAGQHEGFLRIINHSSKAGTVEILGVDDTGMEMGPVMLSMDATETVHVNSGDLERGNAGKGLPNGLGNGQGDWRLVLSSEELDIEPLAYVRTKGDGLLIGMNDIASEAGMIHRVPTFNPASNPNQLSFLRIVNPGEVPVRVTITGTDDAGTASDGSVTANIPARGAITRTAVGLEDRGLGDGAGKWSLTVSSDRPVQVMSLMSTPSGHLANLSAANPEYLGTVGLYNVTFGDGMQGVIVLLPDSRLYAWLPETGQNRIARGTYRSTAGSVGAEGVVYESGELDINIVTQIPTGGADDFTFNAEVASGDWITGSYTVAGQPTRDFHGYAFTGYGRGGSVAGVRGAWAPVAGQSDLQAEFTVAADGSLVGSLSVESPLGPLNCDFTASLVAINPAFSSYTGDPLINCGLLRFGGPENPEGQVELFISLMDAPDAPGTSTRAIVFTLLPRDENEVGLGAVYEITR